MLGAADIARRAVLAAIAASANGRLVAMASRSPERAGAMLAPYPDARVIESYEALLADPEVDVIYNPLPNHLHKEWTIRALEAGKHVLCEKPFAMNAIEAEEMASAAKASGKHLMEAFMYRFHPAMRAFVEQLRDPIHVEACFGFTAKDPSDIRLQAPFGGGALLDVGSYAENLTVVAAGGVHRRERPFTAHRDPHDPYQLMVESFGDSVLNDRPVAIPPAESIANMRTLDRIREASRS